MNINDNIIIIIIIMFAASCYPCCAGHRGGGGVEEQEFHVLCLWPGSSGPHRRVPADVLLDLPDSVAHYCLYLGMSYVV